MKVIFLIGVFISMAFISCDKGEHSSYDASLVHNNACTTDCPGFEGCDGKTYCNQCEAARVGIGPKD